MRAAKLLLLLIFAATLCLCAAHKPTAKPKVTPVSTPTPTAKAVTTPKKVVAKPTPKPKVTPVPVTTPTKPTRIKLIDGECLHCHDNPQKRLAYPYVWDIPGHINGSAYCIYCHVPNVTKMTPQQIHEYIVKLHHETKYALEGKCSYCHKVIKKGITCGFCHDHGNLLIIHAKHHVGCEACHGSNFIRIHMYMKPFPPKFPIPEKLQQHKAWT